MALASQRARQRPSARRWQDVIKKADTHVLTVQRLKPDSSEEPKKKKSIFGGRKKSSDKPPPRRGVADVRLSLWIDPRVATSANCLRRFTVQP